MQKKGIDVSSWQGTIDWQKVKSDGIEFAIIRCGYGQNIISQDDNTFKKNADECTRLGIPFGVYLYSYATSVDKAKSEAEHVLRLIKDYNLDYGIWYDLEDNETTAQCSKSLIGEMIRPRIVYIDEECVKWTIEEKDILPQKEVTLFPVQTPEGAHVSVKPHLKVKKKVN